MNEKARALTIEAILALLVVAAISAVPMQAQKAGLLELLVLQKENDLLKLWLLEGELDENMLANDFAFVFPNLGGTIAFGEKQIKISGSGGKTIRSISSGALFLSKNHELVKLRITVHC